MTGLLARRRAIEELEPLGRARRRGSLARSNDADAPARQHELDLVPGGDAEFVGDPLGDAYLELTRHPCHFLTLVRIESRGKPGTSPDAGARLRRPAESVFSIEKEFFPCGKNIFRSHMLPAPASSLYQPLDELLGTRASVRVLRVLAAYGGRLAVADIARRAKLTLPSVRTTLGRLLALEVVSGVGVGRSMVCGLRPEHPLVPVLVELFRAELEQATSVLRAARDVARGLTPTPTAVWLYGSVARGEDDAASDIDIALVTGAPEATAQAEVLRDAISRTRAASAERVSVITMTPADIRRAARERTPFWDSMKRDAVVLLGDAPADVVGRARRPEGRRKR